MSNPTYNGVGTGLIFSINNNYVIAPTFTKILGRHTIKAGADLRRLEMAYFQNNSPGGVFTFDNVFTGQSATSPGSTGNPFASFLLGDVSGTAVSGTSQTVQIAPPTLQTIYYQGYYAQDTWQANNKLTLTLGLRYEIPGVYVARHGYADTFNPTETNPIVGVPGAFDLVNTPQHPASGVRNEHFDIFSPRLGLAYRLNDATVVRLGWGRFIIPSDLQFPEAPLQAGINFINNLMVQSTNSNQTPANTLGQSLSEWAGWAAASQPELSADPSRWKSAGFAGDRTQWRNVSVELRGAAPASHGHRSRGGVRGPARRESSHQPHHQPGAGQHSESGSSGPHVCQRRSEGLLLHQIGGESVLRENLARRPTKCERHCEPVSQAISAVWQYLEFRKLCRCKQLSIRCR